jgi:hypothetical protein
MLVPAKAGIGVGGLLNQALQAHHLVGHRCFLDQVGVRNPTHNRRIIDDRPRSRPPLRRQMKARDGRLRYRPATPLGGTRPVCPADGLFAAIGAVSLAAIFGLFRAPKQSISRQILISESTCRSKPALLDRAAMLASTLSRPQLCRPQDDPGCRRTVFLVWTSLLTAGLIL